MTQGILIGVLVGLVLGLIYGRWHTRRRRTFLTSLRTELMIEIPKAVAADVDRSLSEAFLAGEEPTVSFLTKKMTTYEAGEDGPLCEKCSHRWCPGDCEEETVT